MVKVKLGGWSFKVKNQWSEVTYSEAQKLYETEEHQLRERINILISPPLPRTLKVSSGHLLALYELVSFVGDLPELVEDTFELPKVQTWKFRDFEKCRRAITKHKEELALTFARVAEVLDQHEEKYLEVGAKALDAIQAYTESLDSWGVFESSEPSPEELNAGIERLQAFGVFGMLDRLATKYSVTPEDVEEWTVNDVFVKWAYLLESSKYEANLQKGEKL